MTIIICGKPKL